MHHLRRLLWIALTAVAVALAVGLALRRVAPDEGDAYALGGVMGRLLLALVVVLLVRLIARRMSDRPGLVSLPAALCAAAVLALVLTAGSIGSRERQVREDFRQTIDATAICTEVEGDPLLRVRDPYSLHLLSAADQATVDQAFPAWVGKGIEVRDLHRRSQVIGIVFTAATGNDPDQQDDFLRGFRESAEQQGAQITAHHLAGHDVSIAELQDVTIVAGPIDCGAVAVSANTTGRARTVWTMLAGPE